MKKSLTLAALLAATAVAPAFAQTAIIGIDRLDDRIDDITDEAQDDLERGDDEDRFSLNGVPQGMRGSLALTASGNDGNTDTGELSFAGRIDYGSGNWNHLFGFAGEYGEQNDVKTEEQFFAIYEGSRYFDPQFYAFGTGRFEYDGFATNERDAFLGGGLGYRIVNTPDMAWRVQAGPGVRYIRDQAGNSETDWAGIAASRFYYGFNDVVSLTNDTDILHSDTDTVVTNDFGINYRMTDTLSSRVSYRTDYSSDPLPGKESTDNRLGLSLVVGF